jgi:hypothetical protein
MRHSESTQTFSYWYYMFLFCLKTTCGFFSHVITQTLSLMRVTPGLLSSRLLRGETGYLLLPQRRVLQAQFVMVVHKHVSQLCHKIPYFNAVCCVLGSSLRYMNSCPCNTIFCCWAKVPYLYAILHWSAL